MSGDSIEKLDELDMSANLMEEYKSSKNGSNTDRSSKAPKN